MKGTMSPERQALSAALARISALNIEIANREKELDEAWEMLHQASAAADKARASLDETPALQRRAKRREVEDAEAYVEDLQEHRKEIGAKIATARDSLNHVQATLKDRIGDVVRAHRGTAKLIDKWHALHAELAPLQATLRWLSGWRSLPMEITYWPSTLDDAAQPDPELLAAVEKLAKDANAPLPGE
jgi:chromosome segregation ATPase